MGDERDRQARRCAAGRKENALDGTAECGDAESAIMAP
jgi:hypothetical protein